MAECERNIEVMWLLGKLTPDFRTIADFRKDNAKALKKTFRAFVKMCMELDLYTKELVAIDGSKFRAVNSKDNNVTLSKLEDKIKRIEENINEYLQELDKYDKNEIDTKELTKEELQQKLDI
jgi:transposase